MPLNSSGQISLGGSTAGQSVNLELNQAATTQISLGSLNVQNLAGVANSGVQISLSNMYKKSDIAFTLAESSNGAGAFNAQIFLSRFSTGTHALSAAAYPGTTTYGGTAVINSSTEGHWIGGDIAGTTKSSEISGMLFATQTAYNPATASSALAHWSGASYLDVAGYLMGGYDSGAAYYLNIWKYTYSTTAYAGIGATLSGSFGRIYNGAHYSSTAGYLTGWDANQVNTSNNKLTYNTETIAALGTAQARPSCGTMQSKLIGYFYNDNGSNDTKLTFSTDTYAAWSAPTPPLRFQGQQIGTTNNIKAHFWTSSIFTFATETYSSATGLSTSYGTIQQVCSISPNIQVII